MVIIFERKTLIKRACAKNQIKLTQNACGSKSLQQKTLLRFDDAPMLTECGHFIYSSKQEKNCQRQKYKMQ